MSAYGRICILPEALLYYRVHSGQISKAHRKKQIQCDQMTQRRLLEQLLDNVTEEELDSHYVHSTGYYKNAVITPEVNAWYGRILAANKERRIYDQKELEQYITMIRIRLIRHTFTKDMSIAEKGLLLFRYVHFSAAAGAGLYYLTRKIRG
ncbi:MAG: hypothetical protein Q4D81_10045 [Eubacteriales bacterium]|nr:hypothetical protein [Eubacteriales bacterium]